MAKTKSASKEQEGAERLTDAHRRRARSEDLFGLPRLGDAVGAKTLFEFFP